MPFKFEVGQQVRAVRGNVHDMQPDPQFVGLVGIVVEQHSLGGEPFYIVEFSHDEFGIDEDSIDETCLEKV